MEEEVAIERASQYIIKLLLEEPKFLEKWEFEVKNELRKEEEHDPQNQSTSRSSNPAVNSLQSVVLELTSTIEYFIETFEANVDPRNCYISQKSESNRNAALLFEVGLKVERLTNLQMTEKKEREKILNQIVSACRQVILTLKNFGKRFQGQPSLEIHGISPISNRFCRLFYTISQEIHRFSENFGSKNDRKSIREISKKVHEISDLFNMKVIAEVEKIELDLISDQKRKERRKKVAPPIRAPTSSENLEYGSHVILTRRHHRLATSIQQAIRNKSEDVTSPRSLIFQKGKTHPAGGIATSIISKRKGFLMEDSLMKARQRLHSHISKPSNSPKSENLNIDKNSARSQNTEDLIMKSAWKMSELVIDDLKKSLRIGNDQNLVLGVQEK